MASEKKNNGVPDREISLTPFIEVIDEQDWTYKAPSKANPLLTNAPELQEYVGTVDHNKHVATVTMDETEDGQISRNEALARVRSFDPEFNYDNLDPKLVALGKDMAIYDTLNNHGLDSRTKERFPLYNKQIGRILKDPTAVAPESLMRTILMAYAYGGMEYSKEFQKKLRTAIRGWFNTNRSTVTQAQREKTNRLLKLMDYTISYLEEGTELWSIANRVVGDEAVHNLLHEIKGLEGWVKNEYKKIDKDFPEEKSGGQQQSGSKKETDELTEAEQQEKVEKGLRRLDQLAQYVTEQGDVMQPNGKPRPPKTYEELDDIYTMHPNAFEIKWGSAYLNTSVPMPNRLPPGLRGRSVSPTDTGGVLKYPQRWCGDKDIFAQKKITHKAGAVLIDASGSMNFTDAQIMTIMKLLPGAVIASYSGTHYRAFEDGNYYHGEIRIIARNGRCASVGDLQPPWGGNEIDGTAVEWLIRQEGPRYWITDLGVSYVSNPDYDYRLGQKHFMSMHEQARYLYTDVIRKCRKNKVIIERSVHQMITELKARHA